jgi:hypothetical protein
MVFQPEQFVGEALKRKDREMRALAVFTPEGFKMWQELDEFFKKGSVQDDRKYWYTYFRWYTRLTWQRLPAISREDFWDMVVSRQMPMALLLDIDVQSELLWYFGSHWAETGGLAAAYEKTKSTFFKSAALIGSWQGKSVTVADLAGEISRINAKGNDSFALADVRTKLKTVLYPKNEPLLAYLDAEPDVAVGRFIDVTHFFLGVEPGTIGIILDAFLHPENYTPASPAGGIAAASAPTKSPSPSPPERKASPPAAKREPPKSVAPKTPPAPTPASVRRELDARFAADAEGQYVDIAGVLGALGELSEKHNNPAIAEWYYFDETDGKFHWKLA